VKRSLMDLVNPASSDLRQMDRCACYACAPVPRADLVGIDWRATYGDLRPLNGFI
jgi:hypothetical protein